VRASIRDSGLLTSKRVCQANRASAIQVNVAFLRDVLHGGATEACSAFPAVHFEKEKMMSRLIDRVIDRIVPKATASACSGSYFCNAAGHAGYWYRFCCTDGGCQWTKVRSTC
jgi:hypothetical protein